MRAAIKPYVLQVRQHWVPTRHPLEPVLGVYRADQVLLRVNSAARRTQARLSLPREVPAPMYSYGQPVMPLALLRLRM